MGYDERDVHPRDKHAHQAVSAPGTRPAGGGVAQRRYCGMPVKELIDIYGSIDATAAFWDLI